MNEAYEEIEEEIIFLDSNILVYAYNEDEGFKNEIASDILEDCYTKKAVLAVSPQIFSEFFVVAAKKMPSTINVEQAIMILSDILNFSNFKKCEIRYSDTLDAMSSCRKFGSPYYDSLIAATMKRNGITKIYTENVKDFQKIEGIVAINPFEEK